MTNADVLAALRANNACGDAVSWAQIHGGTFAELWRDCQRGDWMLWLAGRNRLDRKRIVRAAVECAKLALPHVHDDHLLAVLLCIHIIEEWIGERADVGDLDAADATASAAAYAADAAAYAASAADASARADVLRRCADIVRRYITARQVLRRA